MRSLLNHDLKKNRYLIYSVSNDGKEYKILEDHLFLPGQKNKIQINNKLKIEFEGQMEDRNYSKFFRGFQTSMISSSQPAITIYNNGHFEDIKSVRLEGYLGYRECLSNLVPLGYQPISPLK
jgi:hypothetical protein